MKFLWNSYSLAVSASKHLCSIHTASPLELQYIHKCLHLSNKKKVLGVSFVQNENQQIELFKKYHEVIHVLESLPLEKQKAALKIVEQCGELGR